MASSDRPAAPRQRTRASGPAVAVVEVIRLLVVVLSTTGGYALGPVVDRMVSFDGPGTTQLVTSVLGALFGYLLGGIFGRRFLRGVDRAQERLRHVEAAVMTSAVLGAGMGGFLGLLILWPVLLLPGRTYTIPGAMLVMVILLYIGARFGASRGGDLLRFVGARGRISVSSPSKGSGVKVVDSSALMDGRLVDVARNGFIEGTLVVPEFVLHEVQAMADVEDERRRNVARRGLDALRTLQDEALVAVEVTDEAVPGYDEVDAKLVALCRERKAGLITVDANLARVAQITGLRVLNLHALADALRTPVMPGDRFTLQILREGRETAQGVGYLSDGTMVVVERADNHIGREVHIEVTSIMQTRQGRMLFAHPADEPPRLREVP